MLHLIHLILKTQAEKQNTQFYITTDVTMAELKTPNRSKSSNNPHLIGGGSKYSQMFDDRLHEYYKRRYALAFELLRTLILQN